jgi:hypothetical protein
LGVEGITEITPARDLDRLIISSQVRNGSAHSAGRADNQNPQRLCHPQASAPVFPLQEGANFKQVDSRRTRWIGTDAASGSTNIVAIGLLAPP